MAEEIDDKVYLRAFEEDAVVLRRAFFTDGVEFSWINEKVLGCPRNQGDCRCCVHSVMADLLGAVLAAKQDPSQRMLHYFSVQHMIDCMKHRKDKEGDTLGCKFSTFEEAFAFLKDRKGIVEEQFYRYRGKSEGCRCPKTDEKHLESTDKEKGKFRRMQAQGPDISDACRRGRVSGNLKTQKVSDFEEMKRLIKKAPMAVSLKKTREFSAFQGDVAEHNVFPPKPKGKAQSKGKGKKSRFEAQAAPAVYENHAVLIIGFGYDEDSKREFYLVKNSWGKKMWGHHGYGKLAVEMFPKDCLAYYFEDAIFE